MTDKKIVEREQYSLIVLATLQVEKRDRNANYQIINVS